LTDDRTRRETLGRQIRGPGASANASTRKDGPIFPIGDDNSARRSLPVVTFVLIALNVLVFFLELSGGEAFIRQWAFIPRRFGENPAGDAPTILSAMFMHGGWLRRGRIRPDQIPGLLPAVRDRRDLCAVCLRHALQHSQRRRLRRHRRRARRLHPAVPERAGERAGHNQVVAMPAMVVLGLWIVSSSAGRARSLPRRRPRTRAASPT
jgi:hypothetical protein